MAFNARKIHPLDTKDSVAIGISLPFNGSAVFNSTFLTKDAIKANLINYFLTNKNERYLNNSFGGNIRDFIFEQIESGELSSLKDDLQSKINQYFTNIIIDDLEVKQIKVENSISIELFYHVKNTNINDKLEISF